MLQFDNLISFRISIPIVIRVSLFRYVEGWSLGTTGKQKLIFKGSNKTADTDRHDIVDIMMETEDISHGRGQCPMSVWLSV